MSVSILAVDLARHPSGAAVADVVDRVLSLTSTELAGMTAAAPQLARERAEAAATAATITLAEGLPATSDPQAMLRVMSRTLVGTLEDLHDLLRREAPLATAPEPAVQVALDAVTVAWAGRHADLADLATLNAPWAAALDPVPSALPEGPWAGPVRALLDEISRRTPVQWRRVALAHGKRRGTLTWSTAMHEACAVAHDSGRLHEVARAQLAAARALRLSGASTGEDARAIAMATTAAVQALCTFDLLDGTVLTSALTGAWEAGAGHRLP